MLEGPCRVRGPGVCSELADWGQGAVRLGDPAGSGNPRGVGRPCRIWGARGTPQSLGSLEDLARSGGVYRGICCQHPQPTLGSPPPPKGSRFRAASMGQDPFPVQAPLRSPRPWASNTLVGLGLTLGLGRSLHVPLCKPQWGNRAGSGTPHFHHPWTVISAPDCAPLRGQRAEEDWSSRWHRHRLPPTKLDFWDCFDD